MKVNQIQINMSDIYALAPCPVHGVDKKTGYNGCKCKGGYIFLMALFNCDIYTANAAYKISASATLYLEKSFYWGTRRPLGIKLDFKNHCCTSERAFTLYLPYGTIFYFYRKQCVFAMSETTYIHKIYMLQLCHLSKSV